MAQPKLIKLARLPRLAYFRVHKEHDLGEGRVLLPSEFYQVRVKRADHGRAIGIGIASQTKRMTPSTTSMPRLFVPIKQAKELEVKQIH